MIRYIKKIKMELGEDKDLKFVMACADFIPSLQPFQGSCRPVWLFIAEGEIVSVMDGPNVTRMRSMVLEECNKEEMVISGSSRHSSISVQEAVPGNKVDNNFHDLNTSHSLGNSGYIV